MPVRGNAAQEFPRLLDGPNREGPADVEEANRVGEGRADAAIAIEKERIGLVASHNANSSRRGAMKLLTFR
jgi:hypothetical protein